MSEGKKDLVNNQIDKLKQINLELSIIKNESSVQTTQIRLGVLIKAIKDEMEYLKSKYIKGKQ